MKLNFIERIFERIYLFIFALLLSIFPSMDRYSPALDVNQAVADVMSAVQAHDIDAIEAFMCKNIKDNTEDLHGEIEKLIDAIEGEITNISSTSSNVFYVSSGGKTIYQDLSVSDVNTSTGKYQINITWEPYNNFSIEERGIRQIALFSVNDKLEIDDRYEELIRIRATNGIYHLHD